MGGGALSGGLLSASPYGIPLSAVSQGQVSMGGLAGSPMASHFAMAGGQIPGLAGRCTIFMNLSSLLCMYLSEAQKVAFM